MGRMFCRWVVSVQWLSKRRKIIGFFFRFIFQTLKLTKYSQKKNLKRLTESTLTNGVIVSGKHFVATILPILFYRLSKFFFFLTNGSFELINNSFFSVTEESKFPTNLHVNKKENTLTYHKNIFKMLTYLQCSRQRLFRHFHWDIPNFQ